MEDGGRTGGRRNKHSAACTFSRWVLVFYAAGEPVADLGLGRSFLTRAHDSFYSRDVPESVIREFRDKLNLENTYIE